MVLWVVAGLALFVGVMALWSARRVGRRLDGLTQSYWELRYDYTRLRSQMARLDPEQTESPAQPGTAGPPAAPPPVSFVPLSSLKGKTQ
ncbi:MAG TPA: hypothetical protein VD833_27280 [Vicinamibacterales bacterium]|nr:hypothetical protein [Vicinamibacterales bacterium]